MSLRCPLCRLARGNQCYAEWWYSQYTVKEETCTTEHQFPPSSSPEGLTHQAPSIRMSSSFLLPLNGLNHSPATALLTHFSQTSSTTNPPSSGGLSIPSYPTSLLRTSYNPS